MIEHRWQLWLLGWASSAALLALLYLWQRRTRDATAVDAGWGASLVLCAILYATLASGSVASGKPLSLSVELDLGGVQLVIELGDGDGLMGFVSGLLGGPVKVQADISVPAELESVLLRSTDSGRDIDVLVVNAGGPVAVAD